MKSENVLLDFLFQLDQLSVPYVSWKNNHELDKALSGGRDMDVFIPVVARGRFAAAARNDGWIRMDNRFIRYPWIAHYYKLTGSGKAYHIHVYHKLVTGESMAKEYEMPWSGYLMENKLRNDQGIWVLNNQAQAFVFSVRHLLKGGRFFSRRRYKKEIESYREEFNQSGGVNNISWADTPISLDGFIDGSGMKHELLRLPRLGTALRFRFGMRHFKRNCMVNEKIISLFFLFSRFFNKLFVKSKKVFLDGGSIIAITGADGSGKSTMLKVLERDLGAFATVRVVHMGRPFPGWMEKAMETMKPPRKEGSSSKSASKRTGVRLSTAVMAVLVAYFRLLRARKAIAYGKKGYLVLADRWPTSVVGKMDGPRIIPSVSNGLFVRVLGEVEDSIYKVMPEADTCIVFRVPIDTAIERNSNREKVDDEAGLIARHGENSSPEPVCIEKLYFDNNGNLEDKAKELRVFVWNRILDSAV